jgi:hypothetical protein
MCVSKREWPRRIKPIKRKNERKSGLVHAYDADSDDDRSSRPNDDKYPTLAIPGIAARLSPVSLLAPSLSGLATIG